MHFKSTPFNLNFNLAVKPNNGEDDPIYDMSAMMTAV
jgi:hypothetical protein